MPVPIPRQRGIPAVESGQAQAEPTHGLPRPRTEPATPRTADAVDGGGRTGDGHGRDGDHDGDADNGRHDAGYGGGPGSGTGITLLVIEDDPAGSLSLPELIDSAGKPVRVRTARNLIEAERLLTDDVNCILLDLALPAPGSGTASQGPAGGARPGSGSGAAHGSGSGSTHGSGNGPRPDADELATLRHVLRLAPRHAVLALTASGDAERGAEAVRVGAQDYLFRDELDGKLLTRAIRYAVERKRADVAQRKLTESRLRAQENARLERGLLPTPLLGGSSLRFAASYRPGRSRALLGGDFYDTVRTPDGTVHAMIGDVCGHGPDAAALGVELRIAWRALTLAGMCGDELLSTLQEVLEHERADDEIFATLCTVDIAPDERRAGLCLAGHPSPLIARQGSRAELLAPEENSGPALGLLERARWPRRQVELGATWSLMLYTDGLIEGRIGQGNQRLGQEGMVDLVRRQLAAGLQGEELLEAAVNEVRDLNGGDLTDDVAVLLLDRDRNRDRTRGQGRER
ncbi:PP2C family protein-serine/threonine phosphatase [Streptomyces jeddahensis]|uniref:Stage II sporulation protein E (SpoIIE) n=1 Tax=Streptomyces jeddahensis TaxID=1716141 RepID=A0A177HRR2_9ACTN|nr:fused response regulator/phosphatase [Streptomyces jeddahensis]OAH13279.1 stage II sporulation protein E (SpoIIE) [Streptomyces jeddahensis]